MKMKYFISVIFIVICIINIHSNEILNDINIQEENEITDLILNEKSNSKTNANKNVKSTSDKIKNISKRLKQLNDCSYFNFCNKNGDCVDGKCVCKNGWTNYDCSISKFLIN